MPKEPWKKQLAKALLYYTAYREGHPIPAKFSIYLDILEAKDAIRAYTSTFKKDIKKYKVMNMYLSGNKAREIAQSNFAKTNDLNFDIIKLWLHGKRSKYGYVLEHGLTSYMALVARSEINGYCPNCDAPVIKTGMGYKPPIHGNPCDCQERRLVENG